MPEQGSSEEPEEIWVMGKRATPITIPTDPETIEEFKRSRNHTLQVIAIIATTLIAAGLAAKT